MADLPSSNQKINTDEVFSDRAVSEFTQQKIGSAINYMIDKFNLTITPVWINAPSTYVVPTNCTRLMLLGAGGGGGGGGGIDGIDHGGQGGSGAVPIPHFMQVIPGGSYNVTIGSGGAGGGAGVDGSPGTDTIFEGEGRRVVFPGALGGSSGNYTNGPIYGLNATNLFESYAPGAGSIGSYTPGGYGRILQGGSIPGGSTNYQNGGRSTFASGGLTPTGLAADDVGGGGGAGFGAGGRGSDAPNNNTVGGLSAGGGGGQVNGYSGKAGGQGTLFIFEMP